RSKDVVAPGKLCFPGGSLESNESQTQALTREFQEELNLQVTPLKLLGDCFTPWGSHVHWWSVSCEQTMDFKINPAEVERAAWMTLSELLDCRELLESNRQFLERIKSGSINLLGIAISDGA
ncbi:MAG: NUDIX hydrolase, partial [Planctomycetota bacterium]|nr:NUDIX hydrolase [Planctomycetota bacterium]